MDLLEMPELSRQLPERTAESALATIGRYAELADWHVNNLGVPCHILDFDALLAKPGQCVSDLFDFFHLENRRQIDQAIASVRIE